MTISNNLLAQLDGVELSPLSDKLDFSPDFGAIVSGLNLEHLQEPSHRAALCDLFIDRGTIYFRGDGSHELQLAVSRCVGELEHFPYPETWVEGQPELVKIKYFPDDGTCYEINGESLGGWVPWHTDLIYTDSINRGGVLRPAQLSESGGRTGFLDQISAYDRLPASLQEKIADLHVVYSPDINLCHSRFAGIENVTFIKGAKSFMNIMRNVYQRPRVMHPMVYEQEGTGRKVLNVSPGFADGIYELGGPEGEALLQEVVAYCTDEANAYYHDWQYGDMVMWDNWRVLHCATGIPADQTRVMYRTTIAGDYALGRKLATDCGELERFDI